MFPRATEMIKRLERESQVVDLLMALPSRLIFGDLHPLPQSLLGIVGSTMTTPTGTGGTG